MIAALALLLTTVAGATMTARVDALAIVGSATAVRAGGELTDEVWRAATPVARRP
jgi:hypothetical protein